MRIPSLILWLLTVLLFMPTQGFAQQILGPFRGSLPASERRLNRAVPFRSPRTTSIPISAEPQSKLRREPEFLVGDQPPPAAPAGTNYVLDSSIVTRAAGVPPLILASFQGMSENGYSPPDPVIAVGPRHVLVAANQEFRILTRDGSLLEAHDAIAWYDGMPPGIGPFDPRVSFDHFTGRFMMLWLQRSDSPHSSHYLLSISSSDDPTGQWDWWAFDADLLDGEPSGTWADNACLGFDSNAVYIVSNQYTYEVWNPVNVKVRMIPKRGLYSGKGDDIVWSDFSIADAFCVRPAVVYGHSDAYFLLEARNPLPTATSVTLYRLEDSPAGPRLTRTLVPVTAYNRAEDAANQAGGGVPFQIRKSWIHSEAQLRDGFLHAAFSIANPDDPRYSALRYLCINTATNATSQDITFGSPGHWYFFPAVAVNRVGDVAIAFARSGLDEFPGCFFTWRSAADSRLRPAVPIQPGFAHYQWLDGAGKNRWGDYIGAAVDPTDWMSFWLTGDFADGPDFWGTWVNAVRLEPFEEPRLLVDRRSIDFGNVGVDERHVQAHVMIRNGGIPDLTVSNLTCSSPFLLVNPPALPMSLGVFDSVSIDVSFSPVETGPATGELTIASDDAVNSVMTVALSGTGIDPAPTAGGVVYAIQRGKSEDILQFLDVRGGIQGSHVLGSSGMLTLTVDARDGHLYGAARDDHGTMIVNVDGADGRLYPSCQIPLHGIEAICVDDSGKFYCGTDSGRVYRFNPSTAELELVGSRNGIGFSGLVRSSTPGKLWASVRVPVTNDTLYAIDVQSGSIHPIGTTGFEVATESICRASDGGLLGFVGSSLVRVDTLTGKGAFSAYVALDGVRAIAEGLPLTGVAVANSGRSRGSYRLEQNYPNPFNPSTTIGYEVPTRSYVTLEVFNTLGQQVATLVRGEEEGGPHNVTLDASGFSSGVYFYRLSAGGFSSTRRFLLLR